MAARYDRQVRLWGEEGQEKLEKASVCVVGAGATGAEALKNLVLGGISSYTVVDGERVNGIDLGSSFFLSQPQIGSSRAHSVCALLNELNPSVNGSFVDEPLSELLDNRPSFFASFNLVIATQLHESLALVLEEVCDSLGVTLVLARSFGLFGILRPCYKEHCVVQARPENSLPDLRLAHPWPELERFAYSFDLNDVDNVTHKHVPYVVVLMKAMADFKRHRASAGDADASADAAPSTSKERDQFKQLVRSYAREAGQENINEAIKASGKAWQNPLPTVELQGVIDEAHSKRLDAVSQQNRPFWTLALAVHRFMREQNDGAMPLEGSIPDMTSSTDAYVALQKLYKEKAEEDASAVYGHAQALLGEAGLNKETVSMEQARLFCKNCRHVRALHMQPFRAECSMGKESPNARALLAELQSEDRGDCVAMYILLRAVDKFFEANAYYPGSRAVQLGTLPESDEAKLKSIVNTLLHDNGIPPSAFPEDLVKEMVRFGAAELQCVAATIGALASQEAIKLLTEQFVPVDGTLCWDFISSTSTVLFTNH